MLRRCDRYLLREAVGPFALALSGLVLFILLNVVLSLSDLMVDRGLGMAALLRLVLLKVPSLLVVAVPMSALFATFLALGRMIHDREILALESLGIPLRRLLVPLLAAAAVVAAADFAIYNWLVPASEASYQDALRAAIFRQGAPRITSNAFFRGQNDQFFYIRSYDESTGRLLGIHIYDTTGRLFPQAGTRITLLTAEEGTWAGGAWELEDAMVYGFDREGILTFSATVESLTLPIDQSIAELVSRSRTASEMGLAELIQRIAQGRESGQRVEEYIVEAHLKLALPLAAVLFVLLAGSLSLAFMPRGRAASLVLGLLLVALYQGVLWWTQTLGRRGAMDAALAAWIPNLIFGAGGVLLFLRVDHMASREGWRHLRRRLRPLGLGIVAVLTLVALSLDAVALDDPVPLTLSCDEVFVADDGSEVRASGAVVASFSSTVLHADFLGLERVQTGSWALDAQGSVSLKFGTDFELLADRVTAVVEAAAGDAVARLAEAKDLSGRSRFTNSTGTEHTLAFAASSGRIDLEGGEVARVEAEGADFTTCDVCCSPLRRRPYSLHAERFVLYPGQLLVAYGLVVRIGGVALMWLPMYVQPLRETLDAPLFPSLGQDALHGGFAKWSVPFFVSPGAYGSLLVDLYAKYAEVAAGAIVHLQAGPFAARLATYAFPAKVGDPEYRLSFDTQAQLVDEWEAHGDLSYERRGEAERLTYSFRLEGDTPVASVDVAASRETRSEPETATRVIERLPDITLDFEPARFEGFRVAPSLAAGWLREGVLGEEREARLRMLGHLALTADPLLWAGVRVTPEASAELALYGGEGERNARASLNLSATVTWAGLRAVWRRSIVRGASPFTFDAVSGDEILEWTLSREGALDLSLSGSARRSSGIGLLRLSAAQGGPLPWTFSAWLDPASGRVTDLALSGSWSDGLHSLRFSIPFNVDVGQFGEVGVDVEASLSGVRLSLQTDLDLRLVSVSEATIEAALSLSRDWGLELGVKYAADRAIPFGLSYGVFHDVSDCLRVGVERSRGQTWIYASVLAFPEAVVRYAPQTSALDVGR
ncbi:MAG: LptF/LptG family permease [Candidatus Bipolaricaulota bacterium]